MASLEDPKPEVCCAAGRLESSESVVSIVLMYSELASIDQRDECTGFNQT